jgi:large subunit ribosomal protein L30
MTATNSGAGGLLVKQIKSGIGFSKDQKSTLKALGLGKVGKTRRHPDNSQIRGMIFKVSHLVAVETEEN